ncbi:OmpA family protein [Fulvivirgaceae bacterium PWU4]|uniref:OmpA family protein n=1 Tax=Chryseosolibacter histidini TaxID=2782349 RepID=A0AAP2DI56_9BACT|nr:OmpA family protein [Chryseosolibacter histidini]MBT1696770.1 OmpA family protein [Chryseosolibacter histidini]
MRLLFIPALVLACELLAAQPSPDNSFQLVNSPYDEQNPTISPDGRTLFFTIGNHPDNIGGKKDPGDIWISQWTGNQWSAPVHGGRLLNDRAYNAVAGISADGEQLFLHGHYDPSGNTARSQGISIATREGDTWSRPVNVSITYFQNKSSMSCGTVSPDGSVFVFSAETYGTHGVDDLYVSLKTNGKWSEPKNLGPVINTQFQELSPSISADLKTLYFSSNGRKGNGSFDVYSATRLDDTWTNWSAPVNLGPGVNSEGRELYFKLTPEDDGTAMFTSTHNSNGYGNLMLYRTSNPVKKDTVPLASLPEDTTVTLVEMKPDTATAAPLPDNLDKSVKVYGKVTNSKTGEPIQATIAFAGPALPVTATSSAEGYNILVPAAQQYNVTIEAQGFISTMENLDINAYEMRELEMNFTLQPVEIGTTVNLKNVLFAQTKSDILPESYRELDLVVTFLQSNPNVRIELAGHTDNRGIHTDNIKLSQQRVNKVKEYLVSKGVDPKRISGKGYGGTKPIASNDTEQSRKMNRRVEFTIKKF